VGITRVARRMTDLPRTGVTVALGAPQQIADLWSVLERLAGQAETLLDRLELLLSRAEEKVDEVDGLLRRMQALEQAATRTVEAAYTATTGIQQTRMLADEQAQRLRHLVDDYEPALRAMTPLLAEAARTLHVRHLAGIATLLDQLPDLVDHIQPALTGMAGIAPEMTQVTERMDNVGQVVEGLPGAKALRRRGQARTDTP
jgi:septation ring formation regulator EzrA